MSALAPHVPPQDLCREMDGVPELKAAFRDSYAVYHRIAPDPANDFPSERDGDCIECGCFAAPLCDEMKLHLLSLYGGDIQNVITVSHSGKPGEFKAALHNPKHDQISGYGDTIAAALARACLTAAKAGK